MNRAISFPIRTSVIAIALVVLGWLLGVVFPVAETTGEATELIGSLVLPFVSAFFWQPRWPTRSADRD